ncbi:unnamed protein product [Mucor hiemalis]
MSSTILQALRQNGAAMRKFTNITPTLIRSMSTTIASTTTTPTPVAPVITSSTSIVPKDEVVSQLVNTLMRDGKKARAQRLISDSMKHLSKKITTETDPYTVLLEAIETASPLLKLSSTKKGSKVVHVPTALRDRQRRRRAIVWMLMLPRSVEKSLLKKNLQLKYTMFLKVPAQFYKRSNRFTSKH